VGSSLKPYVYTAVIDQGGSPDDTVLDAPISFETGSTPYTPHNYDEKFEGTITLRRALAQSRNIPTLRLADRIGIKTVIDYAHRFGITSNLPAYLPVALGAAEVTLLEQTSAYSVFPNDGVRLVPRYITKVTDYDGRVLEENFPEVKDVISVRTARIMTGMLEEVVQHETAACRQDRHHQRLHRRMVCGLLAHHDLWGLDRIRRKENPGGQRDRSPRGAADMDGLYEDGPHGQRSGSLSVRPRKHTESCRAQDRHAGLRARGGGSPLTKVGPSL
jgi:hypothetical protein